VTESERLVHFARELSGRLGSAVQDMIPPEAQHHLLNAQRELLTALFLIYEHQAGARRGVAEAGSRRRPAAASSRSRRKPPERLRKIEVDGPG